MSPFGRARGSRRASSRPWAAALSAPRIGVVGRAFELDPIVGGGDPPGQRRPGEPDVVQIHQPPAGRQPAVESGPDAPRRPAFGQHEVQQLGLRRHAGRQRCPEGDLRPAAGGGPVERQVGRLHGLDPQRGRVALCQRRRIGVAGEHEAPALAGLGHRRRPRGCRQEGSRQARLVVCRTMDEPDRSPADRQPGPVADAIPELAWVPSLPPPPFVDPASPRDSPRFTHLSPRVAVLIGVAVILGVLLWMARDSRAPVHRRAADRLPARSAGPLAGRPWRPADARDPHRLRHRDRAHRRVPEPDPDAARQRDPAVHRRLPTPGRAAAGPAATPDRDLRPTPDPARDP